MAPGGNPSYYCFACYGLNHAPSGPCEHCGAEIAPPAGISYDERLIWTLRHPDGDRAILAARALGARRSVAAAAALADIVHHPPDPYLAAEALRSLVAIRGAAALEPMLKRLAEGRSFLVATVAREALNTIEHRTRP